MSRLSLLVIPVLLLAPSSRAQQPANQRLQPITSPVRDAGVLHLATGTWTRGAGRQELAGPEVIYSNTCNAGYFSGQDQGEIYIDEGAVPDAGMPLTPSPSIPGGFDTAPGCASTYLVNGFQIAYCTASTSYDVDVAFHDNYEPVGTSCVVPGAPTASFALTGLPASTSTGVQACWIVNVDLTGTTPDGSFVLSGTGTNGRLFGWSFLRTSVEQVPNSPAGPLIAGDPSACTGTNGTIWDPTGLPSAGTGMQTLDAFRIDGGSTPGCYWFQSPTTGLFASFHLELYSAVDCAAATSSATMCFPNQSGVIGCPCGNNPSTPDRGCNNSFNTGGARLTLSGTNSLSNDTLVIAATDTRPNVTSLFLQGNNVLASGAIFGDGVRCAGGQLLRLNSPGGTQSNASGTVVYPNATFPLPVSARAAQLGQPISPGQTRWYQTYYRDSDLAFCAAPPGNSWNVTHGFELVWNP